MAAPAEQTAPNPRQEPPMELHAAAKHLEKHAPQQGIAQADTAQAEHAQTGPKPFFRDAMSHALTLTDATAQPHATAQGL